MDQTNSNIGASSTEDKADTAIQAAMASAKTSKAKTPAKAATKPAARQPAPPARPQALASHNPGRTKPREANTLERAASLCPRLKLAENIARTFAMECVAADGVEEWAAGIRETTEEHVAQAAQLLSGTLGETAMKISMQRIVEAHVSNAINAGIYYQGRLSVMLDLNTKGRNDDRDEDRDGPAGFESKAERARQFTAEKAMEAFALLAAAEGAVSAFAHVIGENWKAYQPAQQTGGTLRQRSAAAELQAFAED